MAFRHPAQVAMALGTSYPSPSSSRVAVSSVSRESLQNSWTRAAFSSAVSAREHRPKVAPTRSEQPSEQSE
eukprot:2770304-Prymnesium_polylepis.1